MTFYRIFFPISSYRRRIPLSKRRKSPKNTIFWANHKGAFNCAPPRPGGGPTRGVKLVPIGKGVNFSKIHVKLIFFALGICFWRVQKYKHWGLCTNSLFSRIFVKSRFWAYKSTFFDFFRIFSYFFSFFYFYFTFVFFVFPLQQIRILSSFHSSP